MMTTTHGTTGVSQSSGGARQHRWRRGAGRFAKQPVLALGLLIVLLPLAVRQAVAAIAFEDVTIAAGVTDVGTSWGSAWGDFNGDGHPDLWTSNHSRRPALFLNSGDGTFVDIAEQIVPEDVWAVYFQHDAHGAAWADFDNDGDQDLIELADGGSSNDPNYLWVNMDQAAFVDLAPVLGVDLPGAAGRTPAWWDWNSDGLLDLVVPTHGGASPVNLFGQTKQGFVNLNDAVNLSVSGGTSFAQLTDLSGDGVQELLVFPIGPGTGAFSREQKVLVDLTAPLGLDAVGGVTDGVAADFNGDLVPEIAIVRGEEKNDVVQASDGRIEAHLNSNGFETGFSFWGLGDITFDLYPSFKVSPEDVFIGAAGQNPVAIPFVLSSDDPFANGIPMHTPGVSRGFYIGYDDQAQAWSLLLSSPFLDQRNVVVESVDPLTLLSAVGFDPDDLPRPNSLLAKTNGVFVDIAGTAGLEVPSSGRGIGVGDFDNDMDLDLYIAATGPVENRPNVLYENLGGGSFQAVANAGGAAGGIEGRGDAVSVADYDSDGFLDLFVTNGFSREPFTDDGPYLLFRNLGNANHWIEIDLEGVQSNRDGIGARIVATAGGIAQLREHGNEAHLRAQNHRRAHFGLGGHATVDEITVAWPSGAIQQIDDMPANQVIRVVEPSSPTLLGRPKYEPGYFDGVYLWKDSFDGPYHLRASGSDSTVFRLKLISEEAPTSLVPNTLGRNDRLIAFPYGFDLHIEVNGTQNGVDFEIPPGAATMLSVTRNGVSNPRQLHLGATGLPLTPAGWILAPAQILPRPAFVNGADLGLFVGLAADGTTLEARWNGDGQSHGSHFTALGTHALTQVDPVSLEAPDVLQQGDNLVEVTGLVGTGSDGVDLAWDGAEAIGLAYQQDGLFQSHRVNPDAGFPGTPNAYWLPTAEPFGAPSYHASREARLFVWKDPDTGLWKLRATGGVNGRRFIGRITSDQSFGTVREFALDGDDVVNRSVATRIVFDFVVGPGLEHGLDIEPAPSSRLHLQLSPETRAARVRIGAQRWPVRQLPVDLSGW